MRRNTWRGPSRLLIMMLALVALHGLLGSEGTRAATPEMEELPRVDINTASTAELVTVPGIGEALAQRIVEFREKNGPFGSVDELLKVRGIGEKNLSSMRPHLRASKLEK